MSEQKIIVGPPKITRFEKARIVGARALQISMGAPILVDAAENTNPIDIASKQSLTRESCQSPFEEPCQMGLSKIFP